MSFSVCCFIVPTCCKKTCYHIQCYCSERLWNDIPQPYNGSIAVCPREFLGMAPTPLYGIQFAMELGKINTRVLLPVTSFSKMVVRSLKSWGEMHYVSVCTYLCMYGVWECVLCGCVCGCHLCCKAV